MKIINFKDYTGQDPILRKGDLVRLMYSGLEVGPADPDWDEELASKCYGYSGFVTSVSQRYGEDSHWPNQAAFFTVAFPFDDGWVELEDISIRCVHRILTDNDFEIEGNENLGHEQ
jgi:hypothetical protein